MIIIALPLLVMFLGLVVYFLAKKPEAKEVGRVMFAWGLFFALMFADHHAGALHLR